MARGGRRAGNRGTAYGNRSDLHQPMPPAAPTGLPYGARGQMIAAQQAVPMAPAPSPQPQQQQGPMPGAQPFLRPTERPNEPVTAGIPYGPGPGPEVLGNNPAQGRANVADTLTQLSQVPGAPSEIGELANFAQAGR